MPKFLQSRDDKFLNGVGLVLFGARRRKADVVDTEIDAVSSIVNGNTDGQLLLRLSFDGKASVEDL